MDPKGTSTSSSTSITLPRGYILSGKLILVGISLLLSIVLFILVLHFYVRYRVLRRYNRRRRRNLLILTAEHRTASSLTPSGLDKHVLDTLPIDVFNADVAEEVQDCSVCLTEFDQGEKVRALPRCGHRFHVDCIDMWFSTHGTCPMCRVAVVDASAVTSPDPEIPENPVADPGEVRIEIGEEVGERRGVAVKLPVYSLIASIRRLVGSVPAGSSDPTVDVTATPPQAH